MEAGGWPGDRVVKFSHSALVVQGLTVWMLGTDYTLLSKPHHGSIPHRRTRMTYNWDTQLCFGTLGRKEKKEEDWQQMLAQHQYSSKKERKKERKKSSVKKIEGTIQRGPQKSIWESWQVLSQGLNYTCVGRV